MDPLAVDLAPLYALAATWRTRADRLWDAGHDDHAIQYERRATELERLLPATVLGE